jgi:hypothetical protein
MLLAALALFLRILIPSGWMPATDRIGLMPCFGTVATTAKHGAATMDHHASPLATSHRGGHRDSDRGDKPCAFVSFACALAEPDSLSGPLPAFVLTPILRAAIVEGVAIGAGLAAPPPPPTGPPIAA